MEGAIWHFRLFGFRVRVLPWFWLVSFIFGMTSRPPMGVHQAQAILCFIVACFVSILIHELGHAVAMKLNGEHWIEIELNGLGGYAVSQATRRDRWMGVIISVAGPFAQFVSGLCILLVEKAYIIEHPVYQYLIGIYIYISIYWALLNLLPIYPLDGSKIVMGVLNLSMGKIIHIISIIFSLLGMLTLFLLFGDSISFLFIYLLLHNLQAIQMDSRF